MQGDPAALQPRVAGQWPVAPQSHARVVARSLLPWLAGLGFMAGLTQLTKREQEARARSEALLGELTEAHRQLQLYADQGLDALLRLASHQVARNNHRVRQGYDMAQLMP